jgi:hypothetical protein
MEDRKNSLCKGPEVGLYLVCLRCREESSPRTGIEGRRGRVTGNGIWETTANCGGCGGQDENFLSPGSSLNWSPGTLKMSVQGL